MTSRYQLIVEQDDFNYILKLRDTNPNMGSHSNLTDITIRFNEPVDYAPFIMGLIHHISMMIWVVMVHGE